MNMDKQVVDKSVNILSTSMQTKQQKLFSLGET